MVSSIRQMRKALVGAVAAAIVTAVSRWVDLDVAALETVLDAVVVGVLVWAVPNAQPYVEHEHA